MFKNLINIMVRVLINIISLYFYC